MANTNWQQTVLNDERGEIMVMWSLSLMTLYDVELRHYL